MDTTQIIISSIDTLRPIVSVTINDSISGMLPHKSIYVTGVLETISDSSFLKENLLTTTSIFIACLAFIVSWRVLAITRKHNKITVKPHIIFRIDTNHKEGKARLYMVNKGLGPCIFNEFNFKYKTHIESKSSKLFAHVLNDFNYKIVDIDKKLFVYPLHSYCIVPEEDKTLIKYEFKNISEQDAVEFYKAIQEIEFIYKGKDFYGEKVEASFKYLSDLNAENNLIE